MHRDTASVVGAVFRGQPRERHTPGPPQFFSVYLTGCFHFRKKQKRRPRGELTFFRYLCTIRKKENMNVITVDELYKALAQARKAGMGSKKVMLSNDDEGNGYHQCFFSVTTDMESFGFDEAWAVGMLPYSVSPEEAVKDYVIIG